MRVMYDLPIYHRIDEAILDANEKHKSIYKIILTKSEMYEFRRYIEREGLIQFSMKKDDEMVALVYRDVKIELES